MLVNLCFLDALTKRDKYEKQKKKSLYLSLMNDKLPLARLHRKFMMNFLRKKNCDSSRYSTIRRFVFQKKKETTL